MKRVALLACLLALAVFSAAEETAEGKKAELSAATPQPGRVHSKETAGGEYVTRLRLLLSRVAVGDELRLVIHWDRKEGPVLPAANMSDNAMPAVSSQQVLSDMKFAITGPDGKTAEYCIGKLTDSRPDWVQKPGALYRNETYFITLSHAGMKVLGGEVGGEWNGAAPAFEVEGSYALRVTGVLKLGMSCFS